MPFEVVHRVHFSPRAKLLKDTEARIQKSGMLVIRQDALARAGINGDIVCLVDSSTARLALRAVQPDDPADTHVPPRKIKTLQAGLLAYNVAAAMKQGGWMAAGGAVFHGTLPIILRKSQPPLITIMLEGTGSEDGD